MITELKKNKEVENVFLKEIEEIEKTIFKATSYSYKTLLEMNNLDNYNIFVYTEDEKVIAYLIVMDGIDCFEIMKIAVLPEYRNRGVARELLEKIKIKDIFLEVRQSNEPAINFYLKNGFEKISTRKNYYKDNDEDAIIMKLEVINE